MIEYRLKNCVMLIHDNTWKYKKITYQCWQVGKLTWKNTFVSIRIDNTKNEAYDNIIITPSFFVSFHPFKWIDST